MLDKENNGCIIKVSNTIQKNSKTYERGVIMNKKRFKYLKLKSIRAILNIRQKPISDTIGISEGQFSQKENGISPWRLDECILIRDYINELLIKKGEQPLTIDEIFIAQEVS